MSLPDLWAASSFSFLFFLKKEKSFAFPQMCPLNSSGWVPYHSQEAGLVHVWTQVAARPAGKQAPSDLGCAELMGEHPIPLHLRADVFPRPPPEAYVLPSAREENTPNYDSMTKLLPLLRDVGAADAVQVKSPQPHGVCVRTRAHPQLTGLCGHVTPEPCAQGHTSSRPNCIRGKI